MSWKHLSVHPKEIRKIEDLAKPLAVRIALQGEVDRGERWTFEIIGVGDRVIAKSERPYSSPFEAMEAALRRTSEGLVRQLKSIDDMQARLKAMRHGRW